MADAAKARERSRRWAEQNPEQSLEWRRANPGRYTELTRAWVKRNPEKRRAQAALNNALSRGRVTRPEACERCGDTPAPNAKGRSRIEAHHEDYAKPLDVAWLCKPCHKKLHRRDGNG